MKRPAHHLRSPNEPVRIVRREHDRWGGTWAAEKPEGRGGMGYLSCHLIKKPSAKSLLISNLAEDLCGQGRIRTADTRLFRPLLYHLSYLTMARPRALEDP